MAQQSLTEILLPSDPTTALSAATKQYADQFLLPSEVLAGDNISIATAAGAITISSSGQTVSEIWKWDASALAGAPASGKLGVNTALPSAATEIHVAAIANNGRDCSPWISMIESGDTVMVYEDANTATRARYNVSGAITNNTTWFLIPVTFDAAGSGGTEPNNGVSVRMMFSAKSGQVSGGTVAGSNQQLQYNNNGAFGGATTALYNPATGSLSVDGGLNLNAAAGVGRSMTFQSGWLTRWAIGRNGTAESGSDAGSDFSIGRYSDAGAWIADALTIARSTGLATVAGDPTSALGIATKQYVDNRTPKTTVSATAPSSPAVGDVWIDSS